PIAAAAAGRRGAQKAFRQGVSPRGRACLRMCPPASKSIVHPPSTKSPAHLIRHRAPSLCHRRSSALQSNFHGGHTCSCGKQFGGHRVTILVLGNRSEGRVSSSTLGFPHFDP